MAREIPSLKCIALTYIGDHIDILFYKELDKIGKYLSEEDCEDLTDNYIDKKTLLSEHLKGSKTSSALDTLRNFLKSKGLPKLKWRIVIKGQQSGYGTYGTGVGHFKVSFQDTEKRAKSICAQMLIRKLYSVYLSDPILKKYVQADMNYQRVPAYESQSVLREQIHPSTINSVDELRGYGKQTHSVFDEADRWNILKKIPEYSLRRSHYLLVLYPHATKVDFSFCPALFSSKFMEIVLKKARYVETVDLSNCLKAPLLPKEFEDVVKRCQDNIMELNLNRCDGIDSEMVFRTLRKFKLDLKELCISDTVKYNIQGSLEFHKYFTGRLGRRLLSLDLSGLSLCENELCYILQNCKHLLNLNISKCEFGLRCYCDNHSAEEIRYDRTVIQQLRVLDISLSEVKRKVLKLLIDNNPLLERLFIFSKNLSNPDSIYLNLQQLERLKALDISFQGGGAYEDFSLYKDDLPVSLKSLNASGHCDVDISHISVTCPYLSELTLNSSKINVFMSCRTKEVLGREVLVPHSLNNFQYLTRLEIRHTAVDNLYTIFKSDTVLPLEELVLEGDLLDDYSLRYIVNGLTLQEIQEDFLNLMPDHVFGKLKNLEICNCNNITDFSLMQCDFMAMPSLQNLTIERCSNIRPGSMKRLQSDLAKGSVTFTCYVNDEMPRRHTPARNIEVIMG